MFLKGFKTGSRNLLGVTITDDDRLFLVKDLDIASADLIKEGFELSTYDGYVFRSFIKGDINVLLTDSRPVFNAAIWASYLTKKYGIVDKTDRVGLFQLARGDISLDQDYDPEDYALEEDTWPLKD